MNPVFKSLCIWTRAGTIRVPHFSWHITLFNSCRFACCNKAVNSTIYLYSRCDTVGNCKLYVLDTTAIRLLFTYNCLPLTLDLPLGGFAITLRHTTCGRTLLYEWSSRRRDLYLTTHNTYNRQTSIPPAGFEPATPARERPQTHVLDCEPTMHILLLREIKERKMRI